MKTKEQLQAALDAIRKVCNEHGVVLLGSCESEGIAGEIWITDETLPNCPGDTAHYWRCRASNHLEESIHDPGSYSVDGIGDPK